MAAKRRLLAPEIARYREVGRRAAQAMTEALEAAQPDWTEYELAGAGAEALLACGLEPCLTLVAGERRLPLYRHATARGDRLGARAMMVFCARGAGLFANLTRFVAFDTLPEADRRRHAALLDIEGAALEASRPGALLSEVYAALEAAYRVAGYPEAIREHHQGGSTGYLAREVVAAPGTAVTLEAGTALAWNPSLRGAKLEDTMLLHEDGRLEVLTVDPRWPVVEHAGLKRPLVLER
nr:M24 family metallopeptidase [Deinobacterium chartae]